MTETLDSMQVLLAPLVVLACGMLVLLLDLRGNAYVARKSLAVACYLGLLLAASACLPTLTTAAIAGVKIMSADHTMERLFGGAMTFDGFGALLNLTLCLVAALVIGMSGRYLEDKKLPFGEFYALILFATAGAMVMTCALDLINVFVGLEVLSVALYILAGYARRELRSEESAVKYFLLGAFASGFLLYGIALIYGSVGLAVKTASVPPTLSTSSYTSLITLTEVLQATAKAGPGALAYSPLFIAGVVFVLVGLGFKASLVPFHSYAPDVYQGAPAPVAAFMSAAAKIGAFGALFRFLQCLAEVGAEADTIRHILWGIALATMLIGNIMAIRQTNLKRMLAFSSVAHAGYLLVGTIAATMSSAEGTMHGTALAADSVGFYLLAYSLMNVGSFAVIVWLGHAGEDERTQIADFAGLGKRQPAAAATLTVLLLSLAGIPLTAGFLGKVYLFSAAVHAGLYWLAGLGLVISVIGVAYYLNLIVQMYFKEPRTDFDPKVRAGAARNVAILCAVLTLILGLVPSGVLGPIKRVDSNQLALPATTDRFSRPANATGGGQGGYGASRPNPPGTATPQ